MKVTLGLTFLVASLLIVSSFIPAIYLQPLAVFFQPPTAAIKLSVQPAVSPVQSVEAESNQSSVDEFDAPLSSTSLPNSLWQKSGDAKAKPYLRSDINDAELVQYERTRLLEISKGEIVDVYIPQLNENLAVVITSSELLPSGNLSLKGHLKSNEIFSFVMTLGETSMFATIGTAEGIYNVSGNRELAWVIPALSLRKQMNTDVLDYRSVNPEKSSVLLNQNG